MALEATELSKILSAKIVYKLKNWGKKFYKLESHQPDAKFESRIFQLDWP